MKESRIRERIEELMREIALLPPGSIAAKTINGKQYYYHRITKDHKRTETYVDMNRVEQLRSEIERRKSLEKELKQLQKQLPVEKAVKRKKNAALFDTNVRTGDQLVRFSDPVKMFKKRMCYNTLHNFVFGDPQDKVFILYGLRRTGKTTLIRQILLDMSTDELEHTAFIQITARDTLFSLNNDLKHLENEGFRYVFIDEVTLLEDFIEGAALFSDIYTASGMKIVLSGTDSLGFIFTKDEQLYDRCILLHTTFISYREFESVLGIRGIDEYIRYGGTMSMGGIHYNENSSFATRKSTDEYIDTAIARNIQHSLQYYQNGGHFRHLYDLYRKDELTSAVNRVVEDINHRFTREVLTRTFQSGDLAISARNLLHDRSAPVDLMQNIDKEKVNEMLKTMLDILDKEEQTIEIDDIHTIQIREYLCLLDLIISVDLVHFPNVNLKDEITIVSQPGMRYAQANALVESMLQDEKFISLSALERKRILNRILSEIQGRMMEDIILLETKLAYPDRHVFQLQFAVGEFDMVIHDPENLTCEIYEIKYSTKIVPQQYKHLLNEEKCASTEHRFGSIIGKYVIYRGETAASEGIRYLNAEEYLKSLYTGTTKKGAEPSA